MTTSTGFSDSESTTGIPDSFFIGILRAISDHDELKVALYSLWRFAHMQGRFGPLPSVDFDPEALGLGAAEIRSGLDKAVARGLLLRAVHGHEIFYLLNSPAGRAAAKEVIEGGLTRAASGFSTPLERPNVFQLYEENIGPLTPLIADALKDAEKTYSGVWTADAIELAAKHSKRSWKYIEAILKRWKEEGRAEKQDRRDDQASRQRDVENKIKRFLNG